MNSELRGKDRFWCYKHGGTINRTRSPEYNSYQNARQRCTNPKAPNYSYYGGRGIEFRFTSFEQFFAELGPKPSSDHSIERKDNEGHYEPGNVCWATRKEQQRNLRNNVFFTHDGETLSLDEWLQRVPLTVSAIYNRKKKGWCDSCILTLPVRPGVKQKCLCLKSTVARE